MADDMVIMVGVREYAEEMPVRLEVWRGPAPYPPNPDHVWLPPRVTVNALNEAGHNGTMVDLLDLIAWVKANRPELLL